jgi:endogenous inhibitor of DNA gyrase (YacG/DUF329 family)
MKKVYSRNCPKCGSLIVYGYRQLFQGAVKHNSLCKPCKKTFQRICPKCSELVDYTNQRLFYYAVKHNSICLSCKEISRKQKLYKHCPKCGKTIIFKTSSAGLKSIRENCLCKSCANSLRANKQLINERNKWIKVFGFIPKRKKVYYKWRNVWHHKLTDNQKQKVLEKTDKQKVYYWGHINRHLRVLAIQNEKKAFVKWRGSNHWMKRPGVLAKVKKSCEKYRGDHHWFRLNKV